LRSTLLRLRDAENAKATLEAAQAESGQKNKDLTAQVEALTKRIAADKDAADKKIAELSAKASDQDAQLTQLKESLDKWKAAQKQAADVAASKEAERAKLAAKAILLERRVADQQVKNAELFRLGSEILTRYEKFGLGTALSAREPFTGITRVKLQSLVQDYSDKLTDQKIRPSDAQAPANEAKPSPSPAQKKSRDKTADTKTKS
jgi:hypothetical protein